MEDMQMSSVEMIDMRMSRNVLCQWFCAYNRSSQAFHQSYCRPDILGGR